jgi:7-cyano-7-deazaguanine synthase
MEETRHAVLLCSGGLDSTTLAFWLEEQRIHFIPLFLNYGQHCAATEFATAKAVLPEAVRNEIVSINISGVYKGSSSRLITEANLWGDPVMDADLYLPYRNLVFLCIGSAYAQAHELRYLYAAFINSNHAKEIDCSAEFFARLGKLLLEYGSVEVLMPFRDFSKRRVAELALRLGVPIGGTFSCQVSSTIPCGACPNCVERLAALCGLGDTCAE